MLMKALDIAPCEKEARAIRAAPAMLVTWKAAESGAQRRVETVT